MKRLQRKAQEGQFISKVPKNLASVNFDESLRTHMVTLSLKSEVDGVGCKLCGKGLDPDDCYYCVHDSTFWCKACLLDGHRIKFRDGITEHFDVKCQVEVKNGE